MGRPLLTVYIDVSDTVRANWRAGIQRVVVQLLEHLRRADERVEVVPVVWLESAAVPPPVDVGGTAQPTGGIERCVGARGGRPRRSAERRTGPRRRRRYGPSARCCGPSSAVHEPSLMRRARSRRWRRCDDSSSSAHGTAHLVPLVVSMETGSVLLELDSVWNLVELDREALYRSSARPESTSRCSSTTCSRSITPTGSSSPWSRSSTPRAGGPGPPRGAGDVDLGAHRRTLPPSSLPTSGWTWSSRRWSRSVRTPPPRRRPPGRAPICPASWSAARTSSSSARWNHARTTPSCWTRSSGCGDDHPDLHLVVVGRAGWNNDEMIERLTQSSGGGPPPALVPGRRRRTAGVVVSLGDGRAVPSVTEGFGLPVIEALRVGVPVVSSDGGALRRPAVARRLRDRRPIVGEWVAALGRHLDDVEHHRTRRAGAAQYSATTVGRHRRAGGTGGAGAVRP